jgi:hypothetical protein
MPPSSAAAASKPSMCAAQEACRRRNTSRADGRASCGAHGRQHNDVEFCLLMFHYCRRRPQSRRVRHLPSSKHAHTGYGSL